ncbi:hypothetical protein VOLCADRAFT_89542 [Volvox carteri f. nagariensis]|uniref:Cytochrome b561 domain-containing protein n=1 Tax=Volvox carteri f. nagariensis TaxID=3068 RepID=D8TS42_VOLCA|nr:uncharacterized protein VOLCADRAFT_89542 [Volvox carteri f. nagariensis]EFJ49760.1 hypothetical protein VOLCADRAFT_89542 [Volvox carteri f. nagariensis]|eukprot:XP_002949267.1 hypothetical protein VOLCADRAFT_89542 [Volvox carteri f. nagariensis]
MQLRNMGSATALSRGRVTVTPVKCVARPQQKTKIANGEVKLMSSAVPLFSVAAVDAIYQYLKPQAEYFNTLNIPEAIVHWGHPGNMAVVLFAMGGYGAAYLGWQIRTSTDGEVVARAKEAHPKLAAGMFFFFTLGALGGMLSLLMQGKPIFESPHVWTGLVGLGLLGFQSLLPLAFASGTGEARTAHAYLGSAIMALFLVHAALGLQLGLSF